MQLTCADLFCGAGGFSEGFREAGFRVTQAVDSWPAAVATHHANHPDTKVVAADLMSYRPSRIGTVDVLIGSPPCTEFSFAKRGGSGDIEAGLRLVYRFLRFVYELEPKWWIMENVPRVFDFLPPEVPLSKLGIHKRGVLPIPRRAVLIASDYGVPQRRARLLSGDFPLPRRTHSDDPTNHLKRLRTLGDVVGGLPRPEHRSQLGEGVTDPVYGFELPAHQLTDHFSASLQLTADEVDEIRRGKTDHSWYGRMRFPDALDKPARTVVATQLRPNREAVVVPAGDGFRRLTVREASSVQSFPITYQWWAKTESLRYRLVGNAVPPLLAFAVAREISRAAQRPVARVPHVIRSVIAPSPDIELTGQRRRSHSVTRKFRDHVPGSKRGSFRIDFDNQGRSPAPNRAILVGSRHPRHTVQWRTVLYRGSGKHVQSQTVTLRDALERLALTVSNDRSLDRATQFLREIDARLGDVVPDASTLQAGWSGRLRLETSPYKILDEVTAVASRYYASEQTVIYMKSARSARWLAPHVAALLAATAYACELANRSLRWANANPSQTWSPNPKARLADAHLLEDDSPGVVEIFESAVERFGPRDEIDRALRAGVEQLTLAGA